MNGEGEAEEVREQIDDHTRSRARVHDRGETECRQARTAQPNAPIDPREGAGKQCEIFVALSERARIRILGCTVGSPGAR